MVTPSGRWGAVGVYRGLGSIASPHQHRFVARGRQYDDYLIAQNVDPKCINSTGHRWTPPERAPTEADMKKPRGGSWYTPELLTRYAILGNRQFAGSEDTGSAYVLTTGAHTPEFPEVEETMRDPSAEPPAGVHRGLGSIARPHA